MGYQEEHFLFLERQNSLFFFVDLTNFSFSADGMVDCYNDPLAQNPPYMQTLPTSSQTTWQSFTATVSRSAAVCFLFHIGFCF
jgi:hypothetical protein